MIVDGRCSVIGNRHCAQSLWSTGRTVAKVERIQGQAQVDRAGQPIALAVGGPVFEDDIIKIGADSRVSLVFVDESKLIIGADGEIVIDEFVYNKAGRRNSAVYNWAASAFLTKTGALGKANPEAVSVMPDDRRTRAFATVQFGN